MCASERRLRQIYLEKKVSLVSGKNSVFYSFHRKAGVRGYRGIQAGVVGRATKGEKGRGESPTKQTSKGLFIAKGVKIFNQIFSMAFAYRLAGDPGVPKTYYQQHTTTK